VSEVSFLNELGRWVRVLEAKLSMVRFSRSPNDSGSSVISSIVIDAVTPHSLSPSSLSLSLQLNVRYGYLPRGEFVMRPKCTN
jgi:hypothetical protein